ncbi:YbjN domain-containing protein [Bradyrhizobium sp. ARR65]|uniref:YbjN domain-containing protein n=1 Tax=Bradyrhizobium sp. ARR65 TaxID=1040989 RepID=UPI00046517E7|nr:YbjN domain-containing protein [Bradyrhizobium sp. ARR65]
MSDIITKLTLDSLREIFQSAGYRVETLSDPVANVQYLRSATSGLAFDIRPGNRFAGEEQSFADVTLVAPLQVQGDLPLDLVNRWNATRRFSRLQLSHPFLVFCLDICVAGGVAPNNLRAQIEIWDRLVQELIGYLREELSKLGAAKAATAPAAQASGSGEEPAHQRAKLEASPTIQ